MESKANLAGNWGIFLALGIFLMIVGILAISSPFVATFATLIIFGWFLVVGGIIQIIYSFFDQHSNSFLLHLLGAILALVVGLLILSHTKASLFAITILLAAYFFSVGVFRICAALFLRFVNWGWVLLNGLISLLLGILIIIYLPVSALWIIGLFIGIDLLFAGFSYIMIAIYCKNLKVAV